MDVKFIQQNYNSAVLKLLIQSSATNQALADLIIEIHADGDSEKDKELAIYFSDCVNKAAKALHQELFEKFGSFGIDDVLNS